MIPVALEDGFRDPALHSVKSVVLNVMAKTQVHLCVTDEGW